MNFEVGQYVALKGSNRIGKITYVRNYLDEVDVVDNGGDDTTWDFDNVEIMDKAQAEQIAIIYPDFTEDYNAAVCFKTKALYVGCQEVPFGTIAEIYNAIKHTL